MNKRKQFFTEGKEGGEDKMDIDDSDKISEPTDNVERILDAKEEEFFPDNPEVDDILRRMGEEWEELEEKEIKTVQKFMIQKGKELALKTRELNELKTKFKKVQYSRMNLSKQIQVLKAQYNELDMRNVATETEIECLRTETLLCAVCTESIENSEEIEKQVEEVQAPVELPVTCNKCEYEAQNADHLQKHKQEMHIVECDICEQSFDELQHLQDHILTNHPDALTREDNNSEIERANNEPLEVIEIERNPTRIENVTSKCKLCNFSATQTENLKIHMKTKHNSYKPCEYFLKDDCRNGDLCRYNHVKLNPGESICFQCGDRFPEKAGLLNHIKTAHSDMPCKRFMGNRCKYNNGNCYYKHYIPVSRNNQAFLVTHQQNNPPPGPPVINAEERVKNAIEKSIPSFIPIVIQNL